MTDRGHYQLRGPVHSRRCEFALFDPQTNDWAPFKQGPPITFDREGRDERRGRVEDTVSSTTFDERGLRTTVSSRGPVVRRQPGLEYGLGMSVGQLRDVLARYDERDRPVEIILRDVDEKTIYRTLLSYDSHDRIHREEVRYGESLGGSWGTTASELESDQPLTAERIEEFKAQITASLRDQVFSTREYTYDDRGRVAQLSECMPPVSEDTRTFAYDEHDNVIEEHYQGSSRETDSDTDGNLVTSNENTYESWNRYQYRYDERGNWVERVMFQRVAPARDFQRSSIERRTLTYFD